MSGMTHVGEVMDHSHHHSQDVGEQEGEGQGMESLPRRSRGRGMSGITHKT